MRALLEEVKAARRVSTPILAVTTADQPETARRLATLLANGANAPVLPWNLTDGLAPASRSAVDLLPQLLGELYGDATVDSVVALRVIGKLPQDGAAILHNAQRILDHAPVVQAIANLRDRFKQNRRTLILLAPALRLPAELRHDVLVIDDPLPDQSALQAIVAAQYDAAGWGARRTACSGRPRWRCAGCRPLRPSRPWRCR